MKKCTKCKQVKNRDEFPRCIANADGLLSWCKACAAEKQKALQKKKALEKEKFGFI